MGRPPRSKAPTYQHRVEAELSAAGDFLTVENLVARTRIDKEHVFHALLSAHKYRAADFLKENGHTYWFATPSTDERSKRIEERAPEPPGNRSGASKRKPTVASRLAAEANEIADKLRRARK